MPSQALIDQVKTLVRLGYPAMFSMSDDKFTEALFAIDPHLPNGVERPDPLLGSVPFVLVINSSRATPSQTLPLVTRRGKQAVEKLHPKSLSDFAIVQAATIPEGDAYVMLAVDRGGNTLNIAPDDAYPSIGQEGRSPLTIAEGIALLTHYPEFLQPNNCFSLLASRCGDKRVPALWLSESRPKLGWCWAGNPHTWLGSASCSSRVGSITL